MHTRSVTARAAWAAICATLWTLSWIIAEGIPIFNDVLGLAVCVVQAVVETNGAWLISPIEFSLCQLVFFRPPGSILALPEPKLLGPVLEAVDPFRHQYGALAVSAHDCECLTTSPSSGKKLTSGSV